MKLLDANILILANHAGDPHHLQARTWLENALWDEEPVAVTWNGLLAFLRIATNPRVLKSPMSTKEAVGVIDELLEEGGMQILSPTDRHWDTLKELLDAGSIRGSLVMDADLAATALEHRATLCSADSDFARFAGLKLENPVR